MTAASAEAARRCTFAIISHPDAGKTTLTEKFLLYGGALDHEDRKGRALSPGACPRSRQPVNPVGGVVRRISEEGLQGADELLGIGDAAAMEASG